MPTSLPRAIAAASTLLCAGCGPGWLASGELSTEIDQPIDVFVLPALVDPGVAIAGALDQSLHTGASIDDRITSIRLESVRLYSRGEEDADGDGGTTAETSPADPCAPGRPPLSFVYAITLSLQGPDREIPVVRYALEPPRRDDPTGPCAIAVTADSDVELVEALRQSEVGVGIAVEGVGPPSDVRVGGSVTLRARARVGLP